MVWDISICLGRSAVLVLSYVPCAPSVSSAGRAIGEAEKMNVFFALYSTTQQQLEILVCYQRCFSPVART